MITFGSHPTPIRCLKKPYRKDSPRNGSGAGEPSCSGRRPTRMRRQLTVLTALLALAAMASCGDGTGTTSTDEPDPGTPTSGAEGTGTIAVHIEDVDGVFTEGFEVGLRFETTDGEVIASTLWTDSAA